MTSNIPAKTADGRRRLRQKKAVRGYGVYGVVRPMKYQAVKR